MMDPAPRSDWDCDTMWSSFAKYRKGRDIIRPVLSGGWQFWSSGSQEKFEQLNNKARSSETGPKVRFDGLEETESERFNVRKLRGRNIFQSDEVASVVSDNTHLYRRSRSAVSQTTRLEHSKSEIHSMLLTPALLFHKETT